MPDAIFVLSFSMIVGAVSMLPGGLGSTEVTAVVMLTALGVNLDAAVASTALVRVTTFWFAVGIGVGLLPVAIGAATRSGDSGWLRSRERVVSRWAERELNGWGRVHKARAWPRGRNGGDRAGGQSFASDGSLLAFGAGRSYGDVALNSGGRAVITTRLNRLLCVRPRHRAPRRRAGVSFGELFATFLPLGFAPPVAPGTGFATLGGGVATTCTARTTTSGQPRSASRMDRPALPTMNPATTRADNSALWRATLGGLGLTGLIERVALRLKRVPSNALRVRKRRIQDLDEFLAAFAEHSQTDYVVGWIDARDRGRHLGRGILETATPADRSLEPSDEKHSRVPFDFPSIALNGITVRAFN